MKIAIIGCSYSAYNQASVFENHWSFQLSELYPQHQYYSYALGGRGIDYFQWCLLDAFERGIDAVFLSSTYMHRVQYLVDFKEKIYHGFDKRDITDNFCVMDFDAAHVWTSSHDGKEVKSTPPLYVDEMPQQTKAFSQIGVEQSISENRYRYIAKWYKHAANMYNFKHFVTLNFHKGDLAEQFMGKDNVWNLMSDTFGTPGYGNHVLYPLGIVIDEVDDHWTYKGNHWVLHNYILKKPETNFLTNM